MATPTREPASEHHASRQRSPHDAGAWRESPPPLPPPRDTRQDRLIAAASHLAGTRPSPQRDAAADALKTVSGQMFILPLSQVT